MDTAAHARLDRWMQSLLTKADRLIDLADHGIAIPGDPVRVVFSLVGGTRLQLAPSAELTELSRTARDTLAAEGEHVLWLAVGALTWTDRDARSHVSPLVLWPVMFEASDRLVAATGRAPRLNDALAMRLAADHELVLAANEPLDLVAVFDTASALAADNPGWSVERSVRLGAFSFAELDMWRDLDARGDEPFVGPLEWLLDLEPAPAQPAGAATMVAQGFATPLDADASQLAAIATASLGGSFVLQGPPGTGKSQTIANLAVQCASQGTSVLVVSDRVAALDAVQRRLGAIGLGDFCTIAGQPLVPARASAPAWGPAALGNTRLAEVTQQLDDHVAVLHGGTGLGLSVHEVIGRLVELRTTPNAALAEADAAALDKATFDRRKRAVTELAEAGLAVEPVAAHPWRASALGAWTWDGTIRATQALETAAEAATTLASAMVELGKLIPNIITRTAEQLRAVGALAELAAASPRPGADLFSGPRQRIDDIGERIALIRARGGGSIEVPRDPAAFMAIATRHRALVAEVDDRFTAEGVATLDAPELWTQLKKWTTSMAALRFVALRDARARVKAAALPMQLETDDAMITALEAVIAERACRAALEAAAEPARRWFGELAGETLRLELDKIEAAIAWSSELRRAFDQVAVFGGESGRQNAWRALVAQVAAGPTSLDRNDLSLFARLADAVSRWEPSVAELSTATGIAQAILGAGQDHLAVLRTQIDALHRTVGTLADWTRFHLARRGAVDAGIRAAVVAFERADLEAKELALAWERATLLAWLDAALARTPELAQFDGIRHHTTVTSFADLDRGAMAVARGRMPRRASCVLATPQAIARCNLPMFDLVVFDEASRLPVAHALGALSRARAAIIVGDVRQPAPADGADGLLDIALASGLPELVLSTHYRSRHHDLFAFANARYYFDLVEVLPSATYRSVDLGLAWRRVDGAPGLTGANHAEAELIVGEVAAALRDGKRSVAIVALSRAQQRLIEDLLDAAGVARTGDEPLLVGTPDRLQGEERDLVYLSIGDSADAFGALAHPGGERWLDVAITRARDQLVLVSSFAPEDVAADAPAAARGVAELLAFARDGGTALTDATPASPITAAIARALGERGWIVNHRVGNGAAAVELAVMDPDDPHACVLAIEHDGPVYANATTARDRDRLRVQQLARLGWRIHRIWSLDWWTDPERETQRAHGAIVAAIAAGRQRRAPQASVAVKPRRRLAAGSIPTEVAQTPALAADPAAVLAAGSGPTDALAAPAIADTTPVRLARGAIAIGPYTAAAIPCGRRLPDDMFAGRHTGELATVVEKVLAAEAPIHVDLLARRTAAYFGVGRLTPRITDQIRAVLDGRGRFGDEPDIVWRTDQDPTAIPGVRVAGSNAVACRDIAEIPLSEVAAAARIVVERASGLAQSDLVRDCARLLGFARLTDKVTERVVRGVELAAARELIAIENGRAHLSL